MKGKHEYIVATDSAALTMLPFECLFTEGGYSHYVTHLKMELKKVGLLYLTQCFQCGSIKRKSTHRIAIENYIDEIAVIIPSPIQLHSHYDKQALILASYQEIVCYPRRGYCDKPILPQAIDNKILSLTAKRILQIVARCTNLISGECCITCTDLYRLADIPRATIDKVMNSPVIRSVLVKEKFNGCKEMGFSWTEKGRNIMLTTSLENYAARQSDGLGTDWPNYSFRVHTVLIKRLRDEYKKQLKKSQIPTVQKEAAISLTLLDSY
jgi:hypothetical protein